VYPDEPAARSPEADGRAPGREPEPGVPTASRRLASALEVLLCSGFPTQLLLSVVLAVAGLAPFDARGRLSGTYVFTLSLLDAVLVTSLVVFFLRIDGERPRDVLLGPRRPAREALVGLALVPVVFGIAFAVLAFVQVRFPWLHNVTRNPLEGLIRSPADALVFAAVTVASGGLREEIQRAFILHRFEQHLGGAIPGLLLFSVIFGAGHAIQGWDAMVTTAALGAFWGVVYLRRRSIVAPVISHAGFDVAQVFRYTL
jgi:membrane protease YdiL (CAAX protease family)